MQPKDPNELPVNVPPRDASLHINDRSVTMPQPVQQTQDILRSDLDRVYQSDAELTEPVSQRAERHGAVDFTPATSLEPENPYARTHDESNHQVNATAWEKYHSAWQNYYQQYYERYYVGQVNQAKQALEAEAQKNRENTPVTEAEAMYELRSDLIGKVQARARKVRKSRQFWPMIAALSVMLIFILLQYNQVFGAYIYTYLRPGGTGDVNHIADPNDTSTITQDDRLIIPRIGVNAPIIFDAVASSSASLNAAMDKGVAWFNIAQAHSRPGENGNFVLSGHSSNDWSETGDYKFIFGPLEQMKVDDTFYVNYQQKRYVYKITEMRVVKPTDVSALATDNSKPIITLITCTPLGTDWNRLLVFADQISPDPTTATAPSSSSNAANAQMPNNAPTVLEKLFGGGGN